MIDLIEKYFPEITSIQKERMEALMRLYPAWNDKINVISRKDIVNLEERHILHSLAIVKFINFSTDSNILDLGTGGGFPGIPLAIMFPELRFHLVDRIKKKLHVAEEIANAIGLKNVSFQHGDIGECHQKFDFAVSRAVMPQPDLVKCVRKNISSIERNAIPNGLISLKGGELTEELRHISSLTEIVDLSTYFDESFFKTKKLIYTSI